MDRTKYGLGSFILILTGVFLYGVISLVTTTHASVDPEEFLEAAREGNHQQIRDWLNSGVNPNIQSKDQIRPLSVAVMSNDTPLARLLFKQGADHKLPLSRTLLKHQAQSLKGTTRRTVMNDRQRALYLIGMMANRIDTAPSSWPIAYSAMAGQVDMLKIFKNHGADLRADLLGHQPIHLAARIGQNDTIKFLLDNDIDVDVKNHKGNTPLHLATETYEPILGKTVETTRLLLEDGANPNLKNGKGMTPFLQTYFHGGPKIAEILVEHGADTTVRGSNHATPMMLAAEWGKPTMIDYYHEIGMDVSDTDTRGNTALHYTVKQGSVEAARRLLKLGAKPDRKNKAGNIPLEMALSRMESGRSKSGKLIKLFLNRMPEDRLAEAIEPEQLLRFSAQMGVQDLLEQALEYGPDIHTTDDNQNNVVHLAAKNGHTDWIKEFANRVEHPSEFTRQKNADEDIPLALAVERLHPTTVSVLLDIRGEEYTPSRSTRFDPFYHSIGSGREKIIDVFLEHGIDTSVYRNAQYPPFKAISQLTDPDKQYRIVKSMVQHGLKPDQTDWEGSVLGNLILGQSIDEVRVETVRLLLEHGASLEPHYAGSPPFIESVLAGRLELVKVFVNHGANIHDRTRRLNLTPLMLAATRGYSEIVRYLVSQGADVGATNHTGMSPLMMAAKHGDTKSITILLEHGADPERTDNDDRTARDLAEEYGNSEALKQLKNVSTSNKRSQPAGQANSESEFDTAQKKQLALNKRTANYVRAMLRRNVAKARKIYQKGIRVNKVVGRGFSPLMATVRRKGTEDLMDNILDRGADPNKQGFRGVTALHLAAGIQPPAVLQKLLEAGADPNLTGDRGSMPYSSLLDDSDTTTLKLFAQYGAKFDVRMDNGKTPLHMAARVGNENVLKFLLNQGADPTVKNSKGRTAYDLLKRANESIPTDLKARLKPD